VFHASYLNNHFTAFIQAD